MRYTFVSSIVGMVLVTVLVCGIYAQHSYAEEPAPAGEAASSGATTGKVVETMNAGSYTYVQVDDGSKKIWAAAPQFAVAVGDKVVVPEGAPMKDFYSKSLGRTFEVVYFVGGIQVVGGHAPKEQMAIAHGSSGSGAVAGAHGGAGTTAAAPALDLSNIRKADGGHTVAELFANKATLAGKEVVVRGRVAKYNAGIMGKNWIHVQDGTGAAGTNDVTVATGSPAAVGNTVLVRGKLATDKDLGFGYHYDIIIEDAAVTVE